MFGNCCLCSLVVCVVVVFGGDYVLDVFCIAWLCRLSVVLFVITFVLGWLGVVGFVVWMRFCVWFEWDVFGLVDFRWWGGVFDLGVFGLGFGF